MGLRSRTAIAILLSALSGCFLWYSICTYKISGTNPARLGDFNAGFFPEAQVLNGNSKYLALDQAGAAESYKKAILAEPSLIDAWIGLARVQITNSNEQEARKTLNIITPVIASISTWKWQELLFAYDLHDELYFQKCFNYILSYLPNRTIDACWLSSRFWGGWQKVAPHVLPCNYPVFLDDLVYWRQPDAAVSLFEIMEKEGIRRGEKEQIQFCDFLISSDRLKEAGKVWRLLGKNYRSLIHNGGFETSIMNKAFGWRFMRGPDFLAERSTASPFSGKSCLHIHFRGTGNINSDLVYQIVPVIPGTAYTLSFVRRSKNLTTDRGIFLELSDYKNSAFKVVSRPVLGDSPWKEEKIEFIVPAGCEAIVLHVRRDESLKLDNKISGDYWLDSVKLTPGPG